MEFLTAHYHVAAAPEDIAARADALALEQSIEMPLVAVRSEFVREHIVARVGDIAPLPAGGFRVALELAVATTGHEIGQLMNMLFGNCSLQEDVRLVDVVLPPALLGAFPGPRFGIAGLRERLDAHGRALTCTALKPQGLPPAELAALAGTFARAGIDVIKDDHGIANQTYAPFAVRVAACQRAIGAANRETGRRSVYAPSLSGGPRQLAEQARIVAGEGVGAVLAAPMVMGLPTFSDLVEELGVPVIAHPALGGASHIHPPLLCGLIFRLCGADATIFPNYGGRFSYSRELCVALTARAREPHGHLRACLPVPAGGMNVARVPEMLGLYGRDTMLLIGGALLAAGDRLFEHSREFVATVAAHGKSSA